MKISHNLFIEGQYGKQKLSSVKPQGKSYLFNDERAGIVIADRGLSGGSKFRYIIEEHDRLRRVKEAQEKLLSDYQYNKKMEREI